MNQLRVPVCPFISTPQDQVFCDQGHPVSREQLNEGVRNSVCVLWQTQMQFNEAKEKIAEFKNCAINHIFLNNLDIYGRLNIQVGLLNNIRNKGALDASSRTLSPSNGEQPGSLKSGEVPGLESR